MRQSFVQYCNQSNHLTFFQYNAVKAIVKTNYVKRCVFIWDVSFFIIIWFNHYATTI